MGLFYSFFSSISFCERSSGNDPVSPCLLGDLASGRNLPSSPERLFPVGLEDEGVLFRDPVALRKCASGHASLSSHAHTYSFQELPAAWASQRLLAPHLHFPHLSSWQRPPGLLTTSSPLSPGLSAPWAGNVSHSCDCGRGVASVSWTPSGALWERLLQGGTGRRCNIRAWLSHPAAELEQEHPRPGLFDPSP